MSVLSAFTDQKKIRPVYQFKRGNTFSSFKTNGIDNTFRSTFQQQSSSSFSSPELNILPSSNLQQSISSSSSSSTSAVEDHTNYPPNTTPNWSTNTETVPDVDDAIFDFPDSLDEFSEVKVMVASTRIIPEAPKLTRKRSKSKKGAIKSALPTNNKKKDITAITATTNSKVKPPANHTKKKPISNNFTPKPITPAPSSSFASTNKSNKDLSVHYHNDISNEEQFDIFAFDPRPTSHLSFNTKNYNHIPSNRPTFTTNIINSYNPIPPYQINRIHNHPITISSLLNDTIEIEKPLFPQQQQPVEKKRKRNLVAHLKTARGEKENKPINQEFDCLSDEDDSTLEQQLNQQQRSSLLPLKSIIKDRSLSPELTYQETMQIQLDSLMKTEFGEYSNTQEQQQIVERKKRPQYQPLNKMNVRVTFQKK
ncbi:hypothetical protein INT46_007028 [Mucor plumbeus]|uniref:Uncharacterized protein n=1 Tax=Mucor plumbeus TaxID=97098 RepID=A0A8H7QVZ4_9FUNG|nr:hypothetical protein INT46_007028 [Mucor plumbeus]